MYFVLIVCYSRISIPNNKMITQTYLVIYYIAVLMFLCKYKRIRNYFHHVIYLSNHVYFENCFLKVLHTFYIKLCMFSFSPLSLYLSLTTHTHTPHTGTRLCVGIEHSGLYYSNFFSVVAIRMKFSNMISKLSK